MSEPSPDRGANSTAVAFVVAPLVASFGVAFVGALTGGGVPKFNAAEIAAWTLLLYMYAAWATLLLGVPSYFLFRKVSAVRWWSAALAGLAIGAVVFTVVNGFDGLLSQPGLALSWTAIGALSAFCFWLIWSRGHPKSEEHDA